MSADKTKQNPHLGADWENADCLELKAEFPIARWLGFFLLVERGGMTQKSSFYNKVFLFALFALTIIYGGSICFGDEWSKTFGGSAADKGYSVQQTSDGRYIIAGEKSLDPGDSDVYLISRSPFRYL